MLEICAPLPLAGEGRNQKLAKTVAATQFFSRHLPDVTREKRDSRCHARHGSQQHRAISLNLMLTR